MGLTGDNSQPTVIPPPFHRNPHHGAQPAYDPARDLLGNIKMVLWSSGFITFLAMLVLNIIIVLAMTPEIQGWITGSQGGFLPREYIFIITPWPMLLFWMDGAAFQAWHFLILGILVYAFARAKFDLFKGWLTRPGGVLGSLTKPERATSSLEGVAKLFMACMFFSSMYFIFLNLIGVNMNTPAFDEYSRPELIYGLFSASVFEELISRVLLVGLPLVLIGMLMGWRRPASALLGGNMGLTRLTALLIIFSSLMFAFAHVGSWDLWKVPQVLVTGLALGWAFVRYGFHASILIHFSINLSTAATEVWPGNMAIEGLLSIIILVWLVAGAYFFMHYAVALARLATGKVAAGPAAARRTPNRTIRGCRRSLHGAMHSARRPLGIRRKYRRIAGGSRLAAPAPPPPPGWQNIHATVPPPPWAASGAQPKPMTLGPTAPLPAGAFVCRNCGHTAAAYEAGNLRCLRCGTLHSRDGDAGQVGTDGKTGL